MHQKSLHPQRLPVVEHKPARGGWTNQRPFLVTVEHLRLPWGGHRDGRAFRCAWCGHRFRVGETARWVFTNTAGPECHGIHGNPFVCETCDGPREELLSRLRALAEEARGKFWWFTRFSRD